jgi:hypothetical protein
MRYLWYKSTNTDVQEMNYLNRLQIISLVTSHDDNSFGSVITPTSDRHHTVFEIT